MDTLDVVTRIVIDRLAREVFEFASEPDNATRWYVNIRSVKWLTPRPLQIGTKVVFTAKFLGRQLEYVYEVTDLVPDRRMTMRTSEGPFPMQTTYAWEQADGNKTLMTLRNTGSPGGFSRLISPFMSFAMRRANNKDLQRLKILMEEKRLP